MDLSEIKDTALKVRKEFETGVIEKELLRQLYEEYNPLEDLESFVRKSQVIFPNLNCGLASVYLKHMLQEGELAKGRYKGENHTFLLLNDSTVVDITADQYGGPKVYVGLYKILGLSKDTINLSRCVASKNLKYNEF